MFDLEKFVVIDFLISENLVFSEKAAEALVEKQPKDVVSLWSYQIFLQQKGDSKEDKKDLKNKLSRKLKLGQANK